LRIVLETGGSKSGHSQPPFYHQQRNEHSVPFASNFRLRHILIRHRRFCVAPVRTRIAFPPCSAPLLPRACRKRKRRTLQLRSSISEILRTANHGFSEYTCATSAGMALRFGHSAYLALNSARTVCPASSADFP